MEWTTIHTPAELAAAHKRSEEQPILFFKHSTRCPISSEALQRIIEGWEAEEMRWLLPCLIQVVEAREVSDSLAQQYAVEHQSPQLLLVCKGKCCYTVSHRAISYSALRKAVSAHCFAAP